MQVRIPLKNHSYQASIQCWAIIGTPAKRHLMAFRWRTDDGPLIVAFVWILSPHRDKNVVKVGPPLTKLSGSAHAWLCESLFHGATCVHYRKSNQVIMLVFKHTTEKVKFSFLGISSVYNRDLQRKLVKH